jgi:hypothetical protein
MVPLQVIVGEVLADRDVQIAFAEEHALTSA